GSVVQQTGQRHHVGDRVEGRNEIQDRQHRRGFDSQVHLGIADQVVQSGCLAGEGHAPGELAHFLPEGGLGALDVLGADAFLENAAVVALCHDLSLEQYGQGFQRKCAQGSEQGTRKLQIFSNSARIGLNCDSTHVRYSREIATAERGAGELVNKKLLKSVINNDWLVCANQWESEPCRSLAISFCGLWCCDAAGTRPRSAS